MIQKEKLVSQWLFCYSEYLIFPVRKEAFYGKELILADRDMVETESDEILRDADRNNVALLVVGDPFGCVFSTFAKLAMGY